MTDTSSSYPNRANVSLTAREAYEAMVLFVEFYWKRGGRPDDSLALLLGDVAQTRGDGRPADPAMWGDWLAAIEHTQRGKQE